MTHTPSRIVQALLTQASGSLFSDPEIAPGGAWPLYIASMPQTEGEQVPVDCGCVYDTAGEVPTRFMASGHHLKKYGIQIRSRSMDPSKAFFQLLWVQAVLEKARGLVVTITELSGHGGALEDTNYLVETIQQTSPVVPMGQDERRQASCSLNVLLILNETF